MIRTRAVLSGLAAVGLAGATVVVPAATAGAEVECHAAPVFSDVVLDRPKVVVPIGLETDCTDFRIVADVSYPLKADDHQVGWTDGNLLAKEAIVTAVDPVGVWRIAKNPYKSHAGLDRATVIRFPAQRQFLRVRYASRTTPVAATRNGRRVTVTGLLATYSSSGWVPSANHAATLQRRSADGTWVDVKRVTSAAGGRLSYTVHAPDPAGYRWFVKESQYIAESTSPSKRV